MSWMKTSSIILVLVIAVVMMTAGCTSNQPATTPVTTAATPVPTTQVIATKATPAGNTTGLANPASVYCGQVGGKTEIKKDATGAEYGMCTFPNGSSCEEWALYRGECTPTVPAINVTNKTPVANLTEKVKTTVNETVSNITTTAKDAVNNTTVKK